MAKQEPDLLCHANFHAQSLADHLVAAFWTTGGTREYLMRQALSDFKTISAAMEEITTLLADHDAEQRISEEDEREEQAAHGQFGVGA